MALSPPDKVGLPKSMAVDGVNPGHGTISRVLVSNPATMLPSVSCGTDGQCWTTTGIKNTTNNNINNNNNNTSSPTSNESNNGTPNMSTSSMVKQCAGCGGQILDRFLLHAIDRYWHTGCLKCSCCQAHLGDIGTSCFTKSGMILCKNDYIRLFGCTGTCSTCDQPIPAQEFVMKARGNVYHVKCFTCVSCHNRLCPGDRFSLVNGSLICEHDYPKVVRGHLQIPLKSSHKVC